MQRGVVKEDKNKISSSKNISSDGSMTQMMMNSPLMQRKAEEQRAIFGDSIVQKKENKTGLPDNLKSGIDVTQLQITDISSWNEFKEAYKVKYNDYPADMLEEFALQVIKEDNEYDFITAWDRIYGLATGEIETFTTYKVKVSELVPLLDLTQHRVDLVQYDADSKIVTQTPKDEDGGLHYKQANLEDVANTENSEYEQEVLAKKKPIFFEILDDNPETLITTGDGRHRIAVYNAMGIEWIDAEITPTQKDTLELRGVTLS